MVSQRLAGVPMENNGIVAVPRADGGLTLLGLAPGAARRSTPPIAPMLGLEPGQLRVVCPWVGGGFGPKAAVYVEHLVAAAAALTLGRPVKWAETRSEDMVSLVHGRDFVMTAKLGVSNDGKIVGLDGRRCGGGRRLPGDRRHPADADPDDVGRRLRHPEGPVRRHDGADQQHHRRRLPRRRAARGDPADRARARRRRRPDRHGPGRDPPHELPPARARSRSPRPPAPTTTRASTRRRSTPCSPRPATPTCAPSRRARRAAGDAKQLGIGVSTYVEVTAPVGLHVEFGAVEIHDDGTASRVRRHQRARPGPPHRVRHARQRGARHPDGARSRSSTPTPPRCRAARARWARARCRPPAAPSTSRPNEVLDTGQADRRPPARGRRPTTSSSATAACRWPACPPRPCRGPSWPSRRRTRPSCPRASSPGRCATSSTSTAPTRRSRSAPTSSVVEVDTETGQVTMLRHVAVDDCGRILNPLLVAGQQHGGIAQGAAQALYEWVQYDDDGNPITSNLADYAIPSAAELSSFEASQHPDRQPAQPARRQGHRRVGHDRLHAGHPERRRRRRLATSASRTSTCRAPPSGSGGDRGRPMTYGPWSDQVGAVRQGWLPYRSRWTTSLTGLRVVGP